MFGFSAFTVPTGSTINSVKVNYYDREATTGANNIGARLRVGGTDYNAATHNPTTTTTLRTDTWTTNPRTGVAWTVADVNGTSANNLTGFGLNSTDANPAISITSIEIEVDYTPPIALSQGAYAFYDYGAESSSSIRGSQSSALTHNLDTDTAEMLVRVRIQETGGGIGLSTDDYTLQYSLNSGTYYNLGRGASTLISNTAAFTGNFDLATEVNVGQSFTVSTSRRLTFIRAFHSSTFTTPSETCKLYSHSGTYGSSSEPGTLIAETSTAINNATSTDYSFLSQSVYLEAGVNYVYVVTYGSRALTMNYNNSYSGNAMTSADGSTWTTYSDRDLRFTIYTELSAVMPQGGSPLTEGASTTNRLTGGTGSFIAGKVSLDGTADDLQITGDNYTEFVYGAQLRHDYLNSGDNIQFRILRNNATTSLTYTTTPTINITTNAPIGGDTSAMFLLF